MALTKVGPAGIGSTPGTGYVIGDSFLHSTGLNATNAYYTGIVTAQTFRVLGNFQVDGTTTTLDTEVTSVDKLEVAANNTTVGVAITQSGSGDILNLYDGSTEVFSVADGGVVTTTGDISVGGDLTLPDAIIHAADTNTKIRFPAADTFTVETAGTERLRINSSGLVGVNTDSPGRQLTVSGGSAEGVIQITNNTSGAAAGNGFELLHFTSGETQLLNRENGAMRFDTNGTERLRILSDGRVAINFTNPDSLNIGAKFIVKQTGADITGGTADRSSNTKGIHLYQDSNDDKSIGVWFTTGGHLSGITGQRSNSGSHWGTDLRFYTHDANTSNLTQSFERLRIDSSGRLIVGTSVSPTAGSGVVAKSVIQGNTSNSAGAGYLSLQRGQAAASISTNETLGQINFSDSSGYDYAIIKGQSAAAGGTNDYPGKLIFGTTADGASTTTDRLTITSTGKLEAYKGTSTTGKTSGSEAFTVGNGAGNHRFAVYPDGTTVIGGTGLIGNYNILLQNDGVGVFDNQLLIGLTTGVGIGGVPADLNSTEVGRGFINISRDDTAAADHILFGKNGSIAASMGTDTTNTLVFKTGTTERLRIDSSGRVLQGLTSAKFGFFNDNNAPPVHQIQGDNYYDTAFSIFRDGAGGSGPNFILAKGRGAIVQDNDILGVISFQGHDGTTELIEGAKIFAEVGGTPGSNNMPTDLVFNTNSGTSTSTEKLRITAAGQLLVNTTTSRSFSDNSGNGPIPAIQIEATNSSAIMSIVAASTADSHRAGTINLGRHRNTNVGGTPTVVNNGDTLGAVCFSGGDGSDMLSVAAHIRGLVDGTPGSNDMPGALSFSTTPDGSSSPYNQERMRIKSNGQVLVGNYATHSSIHGNLEVNGNDGINISNATRTGTNGAQWRLIPNSGGSNTHAATNLRLYEGAGGVEVLNIQKTGQVMIGHNELISHPNMDDLQIGDANGNRGLTICSGTGAFGSVCFGDSVDGSGTDRYEGFIEYYHNDNSLRLGTAHTERLRITSTGTLVHTGGHQNNSGGSNLAPGTYYRINAQFTIPQNSTKTLTFTGLATGWMTIRIGGYGNAGSQAINCMYELGGYMTATYTYDVHTVRQWARVGSISTGKNASNFTVTLPGGGNVSGCVTWITVEGNNGGIAVNSN